jgi:hypothetical protein
MGEREAELRSALGMDTAIGGGVDAALVSGIAVRRDAVRR